jgi:acetyltransferase-like isoleucine patch superfamily enzyme
VSNPIIDKTIFRALMLARAWFVAAPRTLFWRALGARVGSGTLLPRIHVTWPHQVAIGARCVIEHDVYFKYDGVWAPGPSIVISDDSFIGSGVEFNIRKRIEIGRHALIASGCRFIDHDHGFESRDLPMSKQLTGAERPIAIEDDVWIGVNAVVLKGVTIGRGAIVAAGAVVTKPVGAHEIWAGVPARKIGERPGQLGG